jgi:ABC-type multidrug transport system ATPase subunit
MEAVAEHEISVMLSSHLVADLERVCDYLVVLAASRVQVAGDVDDLLASHHRLTGARRDPGRLPAGQQVIEASHTDRPVLIGMFWGAPLVARELETGTFRLAWTQSVTRTARPDP